MHRRTSNDARSGSTDAHATGRILNSVPAKIMLMHQDSVAAAGKSILEEVESKSMVNKAKVIYFKTESCVRRRDLTNKRRRPWLSVVLSKILRKFFQVL